VGGHCIPVYPHFLLSDAGDDELSLIRDGRRTNDGMARLGIERLERVLGGLRSRRVLVLGAAYREDVKELAFSTVYPIVDLLDQAGAEVLVCDPLFAPAELKALAATVVDLDSPSALDAEAVIVQAWHSNFKELDWRRFKRLKVVLDGRGSVDPQSVRDSGAAYEAIGQAESRSLSPK
jgi:UDP-N-acetyl-D-mannosaminuronate dehydrogenase